MMTGSLLAALMTVSLAQATAQERLSVLHAGDESFTNVVVTTVTATDIYFSHAGGMGNAKLKDLDAELQKRFKYDPAKAASVAQARAEATRNYYIAKAAEKPPVVAPEPEPDPVEAAPATTTERPPGLRLERVNARRFLGTAAPALTVEKWLTPTPATPGKFMLVDFWATWCAPSRTVIPRMNAWQEKYKDRLVIVGLTDESESAVRLMKSPVQNYSVAIDTKSRTKREVQVTTIPHALLVDPQGIVRFEGDLNELADADLDKLLETYAQ